MGNMTDMKDNDVKFGSDAYGIIADAVKEYGYPVWFGFPSGHTDVNYALILGRAVFMNINDNGSYIKTLCFNTLANVISFRPPSYKLS